MASVSTNEFKGGLKFMLDNEPCSIIDNEYVKPGKGQAFNRVKLRKLLSGKVLEKTFKSGESFELADVVDVELGYLYNDGEFYHFMNNETFEQIAADVKAVADSAKCVSNRRPARSRRCDATQDRYPNILLPCSNGHHRHGRDLRLADYRRVNEITL